MMADVDRRIGFDGERVRANVPDELKAEDRWVCWSWVPPPPGSPPGTPWRKVPRNPRTTGNAQSNNPDTWATFAEAVHAAATRLDLFGIGLIISGTEFTGLDFDHVIDEHGELIPAAREFLNRLGLSYAELTPSGDGLHIIYAGARPPELSWTTAENAFGPGTKLEIFGGTSNRYLTFTGAVYAGQTDIEPMSRETIRVIASIKPGAQPTPTADAQTGVLDEPEILSALQFIDATDRDLWLHVGMALKSTGAGKQAYAVWARWSLTAPAAYETGDQIRTWQGLAPRRENGTSIGLGTLFHLARQRGWRGRAERVAGGETSAASAGESPVATKWPATPAGWFESKPPPQQWSLCTPDGEGVLPRGVAGIISSAGGVGKTYALIQLAVSMATRRPWLGHFKIGERVGSYNNTPKRSLLLLGEETPDEVHRRVWRVAEALKLTDDEKANVAEYVRIVPLARHRAPLLRLGAGDEVHRTEHLDALYRALQADEEEGWGMVVIDPQSRFAGVDAEASNVLATAFVEEVEALCAAPGEPVVLVSAHSSKLARRMGSADARGVTGLTDSARWHATLTAEAEQRVTFEIAKNNYARPMDPLMLTRGDYGILVAEDPGEQRAREAAALDADIARVVEAVAREGDLRTRDAIAVAAGLRAQRGRTALDFAIARGQVIREGTIKNPRYRIARGGES